MTTLFGMPLPLVSGQIFLGLVNGSFYAILSMGLAVIFGLLGVVNMTHGALFMMGAFAAWGLAEYLHLGYWWALLLSPLLVGLFGVVIERLFIHRLYALDHTYGLVLTVGLASVIEGLLRNEYGSASIPYPGPELLSGSVNLQFMFLPYYRAWVVVASLGACLTTWLLIEKTKVGALLRAATDNAPMVQTFGINVPRLLALTFGAGAALAAFAGVLAAPIYSVNPLMGANLIIIVFAVVVIGGMGSIMGPMLAGLILGVLEALAKIIYPPASTTSIFLIMIIVLVVRPQGLFGKKA